MSKGTLKITLFILTYLIVNHIASICLLKNMLPINPPPSGAIFTTEAILSLILLFGVCNMPLFLLIIPVEDIDINNFFSIGLATVLLTQFSQFFYSYLNDRILWAESGNILFSCMINSIWFILILNIKIKLHDYPYN